MKIHFLGGAGEYGRSSYLFEGRERGILLDFGVKRIEEGEKIGDYPMIKEEDVKKIDLVLLSHAHDDHASAFPLLYKMGYKGYVYATGTTARLARNYMINWIKRVKKKRGVLPYEDKWVESVKFGALKLGPNEVEGLTVTTGRTGHMLGSVWFDFPLDGKRIFYSGDLCFESSLFAYDLSDGPYDIAIVDASYGRDDTPQEIYTKRLWEKIEETVRRGGSILFPVPAKGRGIDLLLMLNERYGELIEKEVKIYVEKVVLDGVDMLGKERIWLRKEGIDALCNFDRKRFTEIRDEQMIKEDLERGDPVFIIANDAMLSGGSSPAFFQLIKKKRENTVIFTGYLAPGTYGAKVSDPLERRKYGVNCEIVNIRIKAHLGFSELKRLLIRINPQHIFLVHCDREICEDTAKALRDEGIIAHCPVSGDTWEIP